MGTRTTRTTTTRTTTTGVSLSRRRILPLLTGAVLAAAPEGKEKPPKLRTVLAGTVFRDPGFALPGVEVILEEKRPNGKKGKTQKTFTDARGEYAFLLPSEERNYVVKVAPRGLEPQQKDTASVPGARIDVFFTLKPLAP
jgi:hypothetical protein